MKTLNDDAKAAIVRGDAIVTGAVAILSDPPARVWGGPWTQELDGESYRGVGDRGMAQQTSAALGGTAQGLKLTLSKVDPAALELLDADEIRNAPTVVQRLIFAGDGRTLLDHHVFDRGRIDQVGTSETIGGQAALEIAVESAARGLGSRGARMRSDADQRLISSTDGYFKNAAYAGEKMLYFGGKKPSRAADALGGSFGGSGGGAMFVGVQP
jgi:hypothetical protein